MDKLAFIQRVTHIGRPLPDCLVLGFVGGVPVHMAIALDELNDKILVVTVYVPSEERWGK